jgi:hypothetical protein
MIESGSAEAVEGFSNPRSGWRHKAWGGAQRNPRISNTKKLTESAERPKEVATSSSSIVTIQLPTAPRALNISPRAPWGFAALHPRLYATAALCGLREKERYQVFRSGCASVLKKTVSNLTVSGGEKSR